MDEVKRRDFAKQTLKWGGVLSLLAVLNPARMALGAGPGMGNPLEAVQKNPFLQRDDSGSRYQVILHDLRFHISLSTQIQ